MKYIFMDEKGPQNSFKISKPFDKVKKLSYGSDNMHVYVADAIMFDDRNKEQLYKEYNLLEKNIQKIVKTLGNLRQVRYLREKGLDMV
ncbi:hypothetical protein [Ligilactobacillus murinus]|uniref:Uncharacterized protein n=1 Tax=Ligilactobacillus murinus TaxID=1622 RepID=A0AAD0L3Z2_9LACO|nr:hypothetical protein [Ligilactobacillus murinus]AWZ38754.1 hypothetical protein CPS94_07430 [Ligilactobacillus murinus]AWZ39718.1 hypothetical protein CPQ89_01035 [Ligilactobacillus murinus]